MDTDKRNQNRRQEHSNLIFSNKNINVKMFGGNPHRLFFCLDANCNWEGWLIPLDTDK